MLEGARRGAVAVVGAGIASACQNPAAPQPIFEHHYVVYSVLRMGSSSVEVVVEEWPVGGGSVAVSGATTSISGLGETTVLLEGASGAWCQLSPLGAPIFSPPGCYTATLPQPVAALQPYTLEIELPDGTLIVGHTTPPALPDFRAPPDTVEAPYGITPDGLPVAIAPTEVVAAPGASRIDVGFSITAGADPNTCVAQATVEPYLSPALTESHDFLFWNLHCDGAPVAWSVLDLQLHAAAYDANYASYLRMALEGNAFSGTDATFGLVGAVGVFGSAATTVVPMVMLCSGTSGDGCLPPPPAAP
jgi:hypothetical protein